MLKTIISFVLFSLITGLTFGFGEKTTSLLWKFLLTITRLFTTVFAFSLMVTRVLPAIIKRGSKIEIVASFLAVPVFVIFLSIGEALPNWILRRREKNEKRQ